VHCSRETRDRIPTSLPNQPGLRFSVIASHSLNAGGQKSEIVMSMSVSDSQIRGPFNGKGGKSAPGREGVFPSAADPIGWGVPAGSFSRCPFSKGGT